MSNETPEKTLPLSYTSLTLSLQELWTGKQMLTWSANQVHAFLGWSLQNCDLQTFFSSHQHYLIDVTHIMSNYGSPQHRFRRWGGLPRQNFPEQRAGQSLKRPTTEPAPLQKAKGHRDGHLKELTEDGKFISPLTEPSYVDYPSKSTHNLVH